MFAMAAGETDAKAALMEAPEAQAGSNAARTDPASAAAEAQQQSATPAVSVAEAATPANQIVVPNVEELAGHAPFGSGTCYDLGVAFGMPASTKQISPGPAPDGNTPVGTLVGTFSGNGGTTYIPKHGLGHIAAFLGFGDRQGVNKQDAKGMWVMDQYAGRGEVNKSFIPFGGTKSYNNDANNYRIVVPSPAYKKED
jgi:hypothetical protein